MKQNFWADYFTFSKKERNGVLVLVALITLIFLLPHILPDRVVAPPQAEILEMEKALSPGLPESYHEQGNTRSFDKSTYFRRDKEKDRMVMPKKLAVFDPNTITDERWKELGVSERTIHTIRNYLAKGGRFYKPEDLGRIYGLRQETVTELMPYVKIPARGAEIKAKPWVQLEDQYRTVVSRSIGMVDINRADTSIWIALPGIGSKLAGRIIRFRERLGGFYNVSQVSEVYGLPDSSFQKIKPRLVIKDQVFKTININSAEIGDLAQHPYLGKVVANAIVAYRKQHGMYKSLEELKQIQLIGDSLFRKVLPYLTLESGN